MEEGGGGCRFPSVVCYKIPLTKYPEILVPIFKKRTKTIPVAFKKIPFPMMKDIKIPIPSTENEQIPVPILSFRTRFKLKGFLDKTKLPIQF